MRCLLLNILIIIAVSCSTIPEKSDAVSIRYIQLSVLYNYMVQTSPDAIALQERYNAVKLKLNNFGSLTDEERKNLSGQLDALNREIDKQKKTFFADIEEAVSHVAKRNGYTIVLGGGDTVVYAKDGYDITSEVLKELAALRLQKSPAAR